jgi:hypothetical protein
MFVSTCVYETKSPLYPGENRSLKTLIVSSVDVVKDQLVAVHTPYVKPQKGGLLQMRTIHSKLH